MTLLNLTRIIAILGLLLGLLGILVRLKDIMNQPFKRDLARQRGNPTRGILFAFTLGMAPWEKESTRTHWLAYLRGIFFHVGIFTAFAVLLASPWLNRLPQVVTWAAAAITALGALFGFAGIFMRLSGPNERRLSLPDDYASVFLTSLFIALASASLLYSPILPFFYLVTGVMAAYIPLSKIRHCVYFFYSKFFFGLGYGRRGVIGQTKDEYNEMVE
jgi:hypothetical protein